MSEEQLLAIVGRLYVTVTIKDNEIRRLQQLVAAYEDQARSSVVIDDDGVQQ